MKNLFKSVGMPVLALIASCYLLLSAFTSNQTPSEYAVVSMMEGKIANCMVEYSSDGKSQKMKDDTDKRIGSISEAVAYMDGKGWEVVDMSTHTVRDGMANTYIHYRVLFKK